MPSRPKKICPKCRGIRGRSVSGKTLKCRCQSQGNQPRAIDRGSSTARGYGYDWQQFRAWVLTLDDYRFCVDCLAEGVATFTEHLHHRVKLADAPHRRFDLSIIVPLCEPHHNTRTARGE